MKNIQKTTLIPFPELFTFLDRFCPICGSPVSVKKNGELEFEVCTNLKCPYYKFLGVKEKAKNC